MYDAYNVSLALDKTPYKIESIFAHGLFSFLFFVAEACWKMNAYLLDKNSGQKLFIGTYTGVLHVYEVKEPLGIFFITWKLRILYRFEKENNCQIFPLKYNRGWRIESRIKGNPDLFQETHRTIGYH